MAALGATDETLGALTTGRSNAPEIDAPVPAVLELPFVLVFTPGVLARLHFDDPAIAAYLAAYESVKFVGFAFSVNIIGNTGEFLFAATGSESSPKTDDEWYGSPVFQHFSGNVNGITYGEYTFPSAHAFGAEVKATAIGNPSPRFYFKFSGETGSTCRFRGRVTLRCTGRGLISALALTKLSTGKKVDSAVNVKSSGSSVSSS